MCVHVVGVYVVLCNSKKTHTSKQLKPERPDIFSDTVRDNSNAKWSLGQRTGHEDVRWTLEEADKDFRSYHSSEAPS